MPPELLIDPNIRSTYFPRDTPRALARQYHNYGMCKASTLAKHKRLPYLRPMVPAIMVAAFFMWVALMLLIGNVLLLPLPLIAYLAAVLIIGFKMSKVRGVTPHRVAFAMAICHWCYGFGFWRGVGRIVTFRKFDLRPKSGRR